MRSPCFRPGNEGLAKDVNSDLDKGIESNLDAAFTQAGMKGVATPRRMAS